MKGQIENEDFYYHVSLDLLGDCELTPRIPGERLFNEDGTIPRVCVSDSIEGCLNAIKHRVFRNVILKEYREGKKIPLYVYGIRKDSVKSVMLPEEVNSYVRDALDNSEHWILDSLVQVEYLHTSYLDMLDRVEDVDDCSQCNFNTNCHGCEKPDDWDELSEGEWVCRKGCYYPFVDDYELKWNVI